MKNISLVLLLAAVVILAGCTSTGGGQATGAANGISITKFAPDFAEVRSGEPISLLLSIQNVGGAIAKNLTAQVFGGISTGTGWTFGSDTPATKTLTPSSLRPADPVSNLPGESLDYQWRVTSPSNLKVTTPFTAGIRVYYLYNTSSVATLRFYTNDYLKSLPTTQYQSLLKTAGVMSQSSSAGPISVTYSTGARPLIVYGTSGETFAVQISFNNVGNGNTIDPTVSVPNNDYANLYKVGYVLTTNGLTLSCPKQDGTTQTGTTISDKITLSAGRGKVIFCTITSPGSAVVNNQDYSVNVEATYGYFVEGQASVSILAAQQ